MGPIPLLNYRKTDRNGFPAGDSRPARWPTEVAVGWMFPHDWENRMLYYPYHKLRYSRCLSKKFTFLLRLQLLKICFRSKQFCSIIPQLTCRR